MKAIFNFEATKGESWLINADIEKDIDCLLPIGFGVDVWDGDPAIIEAATVEFYDNDITVVYCFREFIIEEKDTKYLSEGLSERGWNVTTRSNDTIKRGTT